VKISGLSSKSKTEHLKAQIDSMQLDTAEEKDSIRLIERLDLSDNKWSEYSKLAVARLAREDEGLRRDAESIQN
jgi:hypothetical protein